MLTPLITLREAAFEIAGRGTAIITGIPATVSCPFSQDQTLVFASPHGVMSFGRVASIEYALIKTAEEQFGVMLSGISPADAPIGTQVYCHRTLVEGRDTSVRPEWMGDLDDDCTAYWAGLSLRAEEMDRRVWWWAVYDVEIGSIKVDSSSCHSAPCASGLDARRRAESSARRYLLRRHE